MRKIFIAFLAIHGMVLSVPKSKKVTVVNESNSSVVVNTNTVVPAKNKADISVVMTALKGSYSLDNLQMAIILRDEEKIKKILQSGVVPDDEIIVFAMDNFLSANCILELVLKGGFNLSHEFSNGMSMFKLAVKSSYADINFVIYLLENGIKFHNEAKIIEEIGGCANCFPVPLETLKSDKIRLLNTFLKHGHTPQFILNSSLLGENLLSFLDEEEGRLVLIDESLQLLFQYGFKIDDLFQYGSEYTTLLHQAVLIGSEKSLLKLIMLGANINKLVERRCGYDVSKQAPILKKVTPLAKALEIRKCNYASYEENEKIIKILVQHGANL